MKKLLLVGLVLVSPLFAQQGPPPGGPRPPPEQLIRSFDKNGDGKLTRSEAPDRMKQHWDDINTDGDRFITLEELNARDARAAGGNQNRFTPPQPAETPGAAVAAAKPGTRAFVNAGNTSGSHDGKTWATAYASVQDALTAGAAEIWVAKGTYTPGTDRSATFHLLNGGALYGGFTGSETLLSQRDWQRNPTILDGKGAYHVVTGADDAILDGFTITGGKGSQDSPAGVGLNIGGAPGGRGRFAGGGGGAGGRPIHTSPQAVMSGANNGSGAGMINFKVAPTVRNCVFENNEAGKGGAVYNMTSTEFRPGASANSRIPVFINCVFRKNSAHGRGGGVSNDMGTAPVFLNCVFEDNETPQKGGGMYNDFGCSPTLINCLFTGNSAQSAAGMGNDGGSSPVLYFCTFTKNHATDYGAPLYQGTGPASNPSLINCLITGNTCDWESPDIYNWHECAPLIKNTGRDAGYRPGRFAESQLPKLLADLKPYKAPPAREEFQPAPGKIPSSARVIRVSGGASKLQAALEDAGTDGAEVRVAPGVYKLSGRKSDTFALRPGVRVYGEGRVTLDGNHAYHVVTGANGALLDGVTITGGYADGDGYDGHGGGLINYRRGAQSRPNSEFASGFSTAVSHCTFTNNFAREGGAVYSYDRAKPVFTACVFTGNRADNGAAALDRVGVESTFEKCEFTGNVATWRGGAVYFDYGSRPKITGCMFQGNSTGGHGGAVFSVSRASQLENTVVTIADSLFDGNVAKGNGGAAAFCDSSVSSVQNCSFAGNKAGRDGNDLYTDSSSSSSGSPQPPALPQRRGTASADSPLPAGGEETAEGAAAGVRLQGIGARMGGENVPTSFKPGADFSVVIIGSGSPQYDPKRAGPSALVQYRGQYFLVDTGNGTQAKLYELGVSTRDISAIMLTHHHLDHTEEFIPVLIYRLLRGGRVDLIGPAGTAKYASFAREFYAEDMSYRMGRRGRTLEDAGQVAVREVKGGETFDLGGLKVTTAKMNHTLDTVGYRFDAGNQSIVISGDLTYSDSLISLARNADVLVMDSGASIARTGGMRRAGGGEQHNEAHSSLSEICAMAQKSGARKIVLTHIAPGDVDEAATAKAIGEAFKGEVIVGHDLLEVVPAPAS